MFLDMWREKQFQPTEAGSAKKKKKIHIVTLSFSLNCQQENIPGEEFIICIVWYLKTA